MAEQKGGENKQPREKKTRTKPVIAENDPNAVAKKRVFGRLARAEVTRKQEGAARVEAEAIKENENKRNAAESAYTTVQQQITELQAALKTIPEVIRSETEAILADLIIEKEAQERAMEANVSKEKEHEGIEKMDAKEREAAYERIEGKMEQFVRSEERIEDLLSMCGGSDGLSWNNYRLNNLTSFLEKQYLKKGAIADEILRTFVTNPSALTEKLQVQAKHFADEIISEYVAQEVEQINVQNPAIREKLAQALRNSSDTPDGRTKIFDAHLHDTSSDKKTFTFDSPDAAVIAVREIVMKSGSASPDDIRYVVATFLAADSSMNRSGSARDLQNISDEDRALLLKYRSIRMTESSPEGANAKARLKELGLGYDNHPGIEAAVKEISRSEQDIAAIKEGERKIEEAKKVDWNAKASERARDVVLDAVRVVNSLYDTRRGEYASIHTEAKHVTGQLEALRPHLDLLEEQAKDAVIPQRWDNILDKMNEMKGVVKHLRSRISKTSYESPIESDRQRGGWIRPGVENILSEEYRNWMEGVESAAEVKISTSEREPGLIVSTNALQGRKNNVKYNAYQAVQGPKPVLRESMRTSSYSAEQAFKAETTESRARVIEEKKTMEDAVQSADSLLSELSYRARQTLEDAKEKARRDYVNKVAAVSTAAYAHEAAQTAAADARSGAFAFLQKGKVTAAETKIELTKKELENAKAMVKEANDLRANLQARLDRVY